MKTILSLLFALISVIALGQTGSINATTIRAKTTDSTSSVVGTGYGGLRFKNQASQLKWQFTNNGTTWYDLPTNPIRGTLTATAIPYALGVYTLGYENALTYDATLNRVNISNPGLTVTSYLLGGEIQLDEPGSTDNITLTVGTASDPSITLLDGSNEQMTIQTDNILLNYIGTGDALDIDITGIARTDSSTPGGDLFKISNLSGDLELETSTVSGSDIILDPLDDLDVQADNANFANTISIRGGSPGSGKVLQSDADGDASWLTPPWIDGTLTAGRVPYASDANTLTEEAEFNYNSTTNTMAVTNIDLGTTSVSGNRTIVVKSSTANANLTIIGTQGEGLFTLAGDEIDISASDDILLKSPIIEAEGEFYIDNVNVSSDRVFISSTSGYVITDAELTYNASTNVLTVTNLKIAGTTAGNAIYFQNSSGYVAYNSAFTYDTTSGTLATDKLSGTSQISAGTGENLRFTIDTGRYYRFDNVPTSSAGLPSGAIWNDSGTLKIVP